MKWVVRGGFPPGLVTVHFEFEAADPEKVTVFEKRLRHAYAVDKDAVLALQVLHRPRTIAVGKRAMAPADIRQRQPYVTLRMPAKYGLGPIEFHNITRALENQSQ